MSKSILLLGPLPDDNSETIGGATISFQLLHHFFLREKIPHKLVILNDGKGAALLRAYKLLIRYLRGLPDCDRVWINVNQAGFKYLTPVFYILSKLFGRPFIFRMFGGDILSIYQSLNKPLKWLHQKTTLRSDLMLLQTRESVDYFRQLNCRVEWLPTSRTDNQLKSLNRDSFRGRFVFISQVKTTKGIGEILAILPQLPAHWEISIYGPILEDKWKVLLDEAGIYHGVLSKDEVAGILAENDVVLLPTYHPGEGYPGILIEAYCQGVPCVTTNWMSIPEIVDHGRTGMLITPKDSSALIKAMLAFNSDNYPVFSKTARKKFEIFNADLINARVVHWVENT